MLTIEKFDLILFDLDGVIYIENKTTPGVIKVLKKIRENKKKLLFLTNNPAHSPREYFQKLKKIGICSTPNEIITSSLATSYYIKKKFRKIETKTAFIIGSRSFKNEIKKTGIKPATGKKEISADIVIMGGHSKFNYQEIKTATLAIRNGAKFIATNRDPFYPSKEGLLPATGALLSSIETASGKMATITGKPERNIFELCLNTSGQKNKKKIVIIGDRLDTDIKGGKDFGISTILTLTGATKLKDLGKTNIKPNYVIKNLNHLLK